MSTSYDSDMRQCPYDDTHMLHRERFQRHLRLCKKQHPGVDIVECRFNRTHLVSKAKLKEHHIQCPDRGKIELEVIGENLPDDYHRHHGRVDRHNYSGVPEEWATTNETWEVEAPQPSFNFQTRDQQSKHFHGSLSEPVLQTVDIPPVLRAPYSSSKTSAAESYPLVDSSVTTDDPFDTSSPQDGISGYGNFMSIQKDSQPRWVSAEGVLGRHAATAPSSLNDMSDVSSEVEERPRQRRVNVKNFDIMSGASGTSGKVQASRPTASGVPNQSNVQMGIGRGRGLLGLNQATAGSSKEMLMKQFGASNLAFGIGRGLGKRPGDGSVSSNSSFK